MDNTICSTYATPFPTINIQVGIVFFGLYSSSVKMAVMMKENMDILQITNINNLPDLTPNWLSMQISICNQNFNF